MSDSHNRQSRFTLPPADLFIHAGDFSNFGGGVEEFAVWFWRLPYKQKLLVLGNHEEKDAVAKRSSDTWRKLFGPTLLHNEACEVQVGDERLVVYGAPYGATRFDRVPSNISILVTHEPPLGVLDRHIGSPEVADYTHLHSPLTHIFGHVHEQGGKAEVKDSTLHVNAATRAMVIDIGASATFAQVIYPRKA